MEIIALYIGYFILGVFGFVLLVFALFSLWLTIAGVRRIITTKQTIRFMRKYEEKATYEVLNMALQTLLLRGASKNNTLEEIEYLIERFRKRCNIHKDEK